MGKLLDALNKTKKELATDAEAERLEAILKGMTTIEGPPGKDGETPTQEELVSLIEPLIPEPIPGPQGEKGDKPKAGFDYPIPKDGKDGRDGITIKGDQGPPGKNGSPDKGEDIVSKINSLPTTPDKQIDASHVKNLPSLIGREAKKIHRGGVKIAVKEEGTTLTDEVTSINFVGSTATATTSGGAVTVTFTGGGATTFTALTDVPSSYTGQGTKFVRVNGGETALEFATVSGGGDALTSAPLSQFAATTSAQLAGVISDETGSGLLVFATSPTLTTPVLGVATATSINKVAFTTPATNATLTIADGATLTASASATVSGTNTGDQTSVSGNAGTVTVADAAGDTTTFVLLATDATGSLSPRTDAALTYNATTNALTADTFIGALTGNVTGNVSGSSGSTTGNAATVTTNANLTGHVTSTGNAAILGSFTFAQLNTAVSDADVARTDAANTFTGVQTMTSPALTTPAITGLATGSGVATANTASTLVARDASGNFAAGTITAALTGTASGNLVSGGALGTPSSGTLTNVTGLPLTGLVSDTTTALGLGSINLGHATDTTIARVSAGLVSIEGVNIVTESATQTLTNKSIVATQLTGIIADARMPDLTGDVTTVEGAVATTIANSAITDAKILATADVMIRTITFIIDGGGSVITTGVKGDLEIPFNCTINRATLLADQSGSIVVDIWKDTYANYPATVADTITASAKPTITTATKSQDATLTGWTTTIAAGDTLRFNVDSITTCTRVVLSLKVTIT